MNRDVRAEKRDILIIQNSYVQFLAVKLDISILMSEGTQTYKKAFFRFVKRAHVVCVITKKHKMTLGKKVFTFYLILSLPMLFVETN